MADVVLVADLLVLAELWDEAAEVDEVDAGRISGLRQAADQLRRLVGATRRQDHG